MSSRHANAATQDSNELLADEWDAARFKGSAEFLPVAQALPRNSRLMHSHPSRTLLVLLCSLLLPPLAGCKMDAHERHHFVSYKDDGNAANYFRVEVTARAFLSSSRYLSGYFDPAAVDTYFGTYKQPADAAFPTAAPAGGQKAETDAKAAAPVGAGSDGKKLVLLMSSNSDEVANQIGTMADGKQMSDLVQGLVGSKADQAAADADHLLRARRLDAQHAADLGARILDRLRKDQAEQNASILKEYVVWYARQLGAGEDVTDLQMARNWLAKNRARLVGSGT